jgi:hypothetical protein
LLLSPVFLLFSWGFSLVPIAQPASMGYAVAFIGAAGVFFWFGYSLWENSGWRL